MKSDVYDIAVICTDAVDKFINETEEFVIIGVITENTDVLLRKEGSGNKIGVTNNKYILKDLVENLYDNNVDVEFMSPHAFPYAYETNQIDGFVIDIALLNSSLEGELVNLSDGDYDSNVIIANKKIIKDYKFKKFIKAYNNMVLDYNDNPKEDYFDYKFGEYEGRKSVWKVKLNQVNLKK
ncbi:MAG: hypothetical protein Q4E02_04115 [Lagierella massiliensis]|nr:hypothetical protein [Lagierella massiliensis]